MSGELFITSVSDKELRRLAISSYVNQQGRCRCKSHKSYKRYGGRGINIEYSRKEFIAWFLKNIVTFRGKKPTVGRIDHDKNYAFNNIEIQDHAANSLDGAQKVGRMIQKRIAIFDAATNEFICIAPSSLEAGRWTKNWAQNVAHVCTGKYKKTRNGFIFRYAN